MNHEVSAQAVFGAQRHGPGGAAHLVLLAALAVIVLVVLGVMRWRRRRATRDQRPDRY